MVFIGRFDSCCSFQILNFSIYIFLKYYMKPILRWYFLAVALLRISSEIWRASHFSMCLCLAFTPCGPKCKQCRCIFYLWSFKEILMIKHFGVSFTNNLASSDYSNLYEIISLRAMWSYYWDEITDWITKCLSSYLMS